MGRQVWQYLCMHPAGQQRPVPVVGWGYSPCQFAIPGPRVQRPVVSGHHGERHSDGELRLKRRLTPRSPSQGFSPERQFCGFKIHFTHTRNISSEWEICVFRGFCVRKKYQRENRNIFHTEFTDFTETFLHRSVNNPNMEQIESTEFVVDFVTTAGAVGTRTRTRTKSIFI